jgi:heme a synthase
VKHITIKRTAILSLFVTYILIVFGGYVASSESGMGCGPEWPLCNGEVIPTMQGETLIEFTHRLLGLLLVILSVALFVLTRQTNSHKSIRYAGVWMMSLLTFQVLAGAFVVLFDLPTIVVTIHLLTAMVFMLSLLWILRAEQETSFKALLNNRQQKTIKTNLNVMIGLLLLTIGFGAYIKHMSYGLACNWLDCGSSWLPVGGPQLLQTLHRLLAFITAIYTLLLTFWAFSREWGRRVKICFVLATGTVLMQLLIGVFTVITNISIPWAVFHLAVATALFIVIADTRVSLGITTTIANEYTRTFRKGRSGGF